jgi:membrane fusion protein (multidrug efflux system)
VYWYNTGRYLVQTDDAYTQADNITVSPQVAGNIESLAVTDNQQVNEGDLIAQIDSRTYRAQVDQAAAQVETAQANIQNVEATLPQQEAAIAQAEADLTASDAQLKFAQQDYDRYAELAKRGFAPQQRRQQSQATLDQQRASVKKAQATLESARTGLTVLQTRKDQATAELDQAKAQLSQAQVNLSYTRITAPGDGVVGDRSVRVGQYVQPGVKLMTIVPMQNVYVVANFKETQLERLHRGQPVEIKVDAFGGIKVRGRVDSLAPGSGSQFALLPPENATGNFTKIVQRVPVKILIERDDTGGSRLRPGLSVIPTIDTRDTRGQSLQERPSQAGLPAPATPP